jgi:hypothetical protein
LTWEENELKGEVLKAECYKQIAFNKVLSKKVLGGMNETTKNIIHCFGRYFACFIISNSGSRRF